MKTKRRQFNDIEALQAKQQALQTKQRELECAITNELKDLRTDLSPANILRKALTHLIPAKIKGLLGNIIRKRTKLNQLHSRRGNTL
jgi:hypothetical protein